MKISATTIEILKNFSGINASLLIPANSHEFHTRNEAKSILATARVPEMFEKELGIFDLPSLLQYLRLMKPAPVKDNVEKAGEDAPKAAEGPELTVVDGFLQLKSDAMEVKYRLADKANLVCQDKAFNIPETPFVTIAFTTELLDTINTSKSIGMIKADTVTYAMDEDGNCSVTIYNGDNSGTNEVRRTMEVTNKACEAFSISFRDDQFPMMPLDYELNIYKREVGGQNIFFAEYKTEVMTYIAPARTSAVNFVKGD